MPQKYWVQTFGQNWVSNSGEFGCKKILVQKIKVKIIKVQNILSETNIGPIKLRAPKIFGSTFGQNWVSNS